MKNAYFAGGCFWCITPAFYDLQGVRDVISGYSGGEEENPTYEQVKHQQTGHRETICITYNEEKVSFDKLLQTFLDNIDAFDDGGQFIDRGHSYTLAIYYTCQEEYELSRQAMAKLESEAGEPCAIALEPFGTFYTAEEYHQNYYRTHPEEFEKELEISGRNTWKLEHETNH